MNIRLVLAGGLLSLVGCDAVTDFKLSMARQALRQDCFGNFTNACVSKTIDFNINVLESVPLAGPEDKKGIVALFGDEGWNLYEETEEEIKDEVIEVLESKRPGWFSRWFLGDAQPFDGSGVMEFSPSELKMIQDQVSKLFIDKVKAAGLKPNAEAAAKYGGVAKEPKELNPDTVPLLQPAPLDQLTVQTEPEQSSQQPPAQPSVTLAAAIDNQITDEISVDGGSEYQDGRRVVQVDLNGDGAEDAVVLFTIEGQGGGNGSFQILAAFYREPDGWTLKQKIIVGGATEVQVLGPNIFGLQVLTHGADDPMCCPSIENVVKYQWTGTGFSELTVAGQASG